MLSWLLLMLSLQCFLRCVVKAAFKRVVIPAVDAFAPELVLVSSGFDASFMVRRKVPQWACAVYAGVVRVIQDIIGPGTFIMCRVNGGVWQCICILPCAHVTCRTIWLP